MTLTFSSPEKIGKDAKELLYALDQLFSEYYRKNRCGCGWNSICWERWEGVNKVDDGSC